MSLLRRRPLSTSSSPLFSRFTKRSFKSLKLIDDSLVDATSSSLVHGVHVFCCPDVVGIVAKLSECIASRGGNILNADVFVPEHKNVFYSRSEFVYDPAKWSRTQVKEDFLKLSRTFNATKSVVFVPDLDPKHKIAVLASKQDHCLVDSLHGWQDGRLPVQITCVIRSFVRRFSLPWEFLIRGDPLKSNQNMGFYYSNHDRGPNTHVMRFLERHGIPYHYLPTMNDDKYEHQILNIVQDTDFIVLARYMQILSGDFLRSYKKDIINIHHGLLPSFTGGYPSKQAFDAGVKLIGATSHFVTERLDAGPIIEQMVERVSHRDNLRSFVQKSKDLEKQCLSKAIKSYCELRVLPFEENKTLVF